MKKQAKNQKFFNEIKAGLNDALAWSEGRETPVTVRDVELPAPPRPMTSRQIAILRKKKVGVSQAVFARLINASVKTVHAWEQGRGHPSGPALRLLSLLDETPDLIRVFNAR
jgi:putative transcriptional regulator